MDIFEKKIIILLIKRRNFAFSIMLFVNHITHLNMTEKKKHTENSYGIVGKFCPNYKPISI